MREVVLSFVSKDQKFIVDAIVFNALNSLIKLLYVHGGSNSGKTFGAAMAAALSALIYPGLKVHIFKANRKNIIDIFGSAIKKTLSDLGIDEAKSRRVNNTYFCHNNTEYYFSNGSSISLHVIEPGSHPDNGNNKFHGMGGNLFIFDEISELSFDWCIGYFFESHRARRSPDQKNDFKDKFVFIENQSHFFWGYKFFTEKKHPKTLEPLSEKVIDAKKGLKYTDIIHEHRCETWNNNLISDEELEMMKNIGDAERFFYSRGSSGRDERQIYHYETGTPKVSPFYIYGMDFGTKAKSTLLRIGYGAEGYNINAKEMWYQAGATHEETLSKVRQVLEHNNKIINEVKNLVEQKLLSIDDFKYFYSLAKVPTLVIDSARSDMRKEIIKKYGNLINVVLSDKLGQKIHNIKTTQKFKLTIDKTSKFFINEISSYRYKQNAIDNSEIVPDGNDDLLDTYRYCATHLLKIFETRKEFLYPNPTLKRIYEKIHSINPQLVEV